MYLRAGETYTVEELLYGMMLVSGNDAAVALACHTAGSVQAFADMMNDKARALGMTGSAFENPSGLDAEGHYSTARHGGAHLCSYGERHILYHRIDAQRDRGRANARQSQPAAAQL